MHAKPATGTDFVLRDYLARDFETIWKLDQICFTGGIAYSKAELSYFLKQSRAFCIVAEAASEVRGFIVAEHDLKHAGRVITIDVHPEARRSGLGSVMIRAAEGRLRSLKCDRVILEVAVDNLSAITFYKRHGYAVTGTIPRYYNGTLDALQMGKSFTDQISGQRGLIAD